LVLVHLVMTLRLIIVGLMEVTLCSLQLLLLVEEVQVLGAVVALPVQEKLVEVVEEVPLITMGLMRNMLLVVLEHQGKEITEVVRRLQQQLRQPMLVVEGVLVQQVLLLKRALLMLVAQEVRVLRLLSLGRL
jgi:hypothetical protein